MVEKSPSVVRLCNVLYDPATVTRMRGNVHPIQIVQAVSQSALVNHVKIPSPKSWENVKLNDRTYV